MRSKTYFIPYIFFISFIAALGGFLFGYHTSIISGAVLFIAREFPISTVQQEMVVSILLIGAIAGAFGGGILADALGRKNTLFLTSALLVLGALCIVNASSFHGILVGRVISGVAVGIFSVVVPLYIAEVAPQDMRGSLVSLNQLLITIGILLSYGISYLYSYQGEWREMFVIGAIPALLQFVCLFFIPETPSWLMGKKRVKEATKVLKRLQQDKKDQILLKEETKKDHSSLRFSSVFAPSIRKAFFIGILLSAFQQITGINTVIYYAPRIFQFAGFHSDVEAIGSTVWLGIANVLATSLGLWLVDRAGRRPLAFWGFVGMAISLAVIGTCFHLQSPGLRLIAVLGLVSYISFFAIGIGIVAWLVISEIYPQGIRGRAMGIASFVNWVCNYLVSLTFLSFIQSVGPGIVFWSYSFVCILGALFVWKRVPETRGKTLEEIQQFWQK